MKRFHLFEFGDLTWFPKNFRSYLTDYLQFAANALYIYKCVVPIIRKGIVSSDNNSIVDIASGGGGGSCKNSRTLEDK